MSNTIRKVNMTKAIKARTMNSDNPKEVSRIASEVLKKLKRYKKKDDIGIVTDGTLETPVLDYEGKPKFGLNEKKVLKKCSRKEERIKRKKQEADELAWANGDRITEENEKLPDVWHEKLTTVIPTWIYVKAWVFLKNLNESGTYAQEELEEILNIINDFEESSKIE